MNPPPVLRCGRMDTAALGELLARYGLDLAWAGDGADIPGSYWGAPEAGLVGGRLWLRRDTPVHSALHECGHYVCMDASRRARLHTDAGGGVLEECAVCYLQVVLADYLPGLGRERLFQDMDAWGYSFRLGSSRAWFETDAEDARQWLLSHSLVDGQGRPTWRLRQGVGPSGVFPEARMCATVECVEKIS